MPHSNALSRLKNEVGVSQQYPITHLVNEYVFETRDGQLGTVITCQGQPFLTETEETIHARYLAWHQALQQLSEHFVVTVTIHRHKKQLNMAGNFTHPQCAHIDLLYQQALNQQQLYRNDFYITLIYRGLNQGKVGKGFHWLQQLSTKALKQARAYVREQQLAALTHACQQVVKALTEYQPKRLSAYGNNTLNLLSFLGLFLNADMRSQYKPPQSLPSHGSIEQFEKRTLPRAALSTFLCRQNILIGDAIQWYRPDSQQRYAHIVSVKQYPTESHSLLLDNVLQLPIELLVTHTYAVAPKAVAQEAMRRQRIKLDNVSDEGLTQQSDIVHAQDGLACGYYSMGYHHNTVMVLAEDKKQCQANTQAVIQCYADAGFSAVQETLGLEPAFWAQIPGNFRHIARHSLITSLNFADFCPLHDYSNGFKNSNHLGGAMMPVRTPAHTLFYLNFHTTGPASDPAAGHTAIYGSNGSGKTVLMAMSAVSLNRYGGRAIFFDRNQGLEIFVRAMGGRYMTMKPEQTDTLKLNPLLLPDTPSHRQFCVRWLMQLVKREQENSVPTHIEGALKEAVDYCFEQLESVYRTLTYISQRLPIDFERWPELRRWLNADENHRSGHYAYLFDHAEDNLNFDEFTGFDLTYFLDNEPHDVLTAVMMVIVHRIENSLDGRLTSLFFDEGWQYLDNVYWSERLKKWLPTLRKKNCHIVLATQSAETVAQSQVFSQFQTNLASLIVFANPRASEATYCQQFGLTHSELDVIRSKPSTARAFLYKQGHQSSWCQFDLSELADWLAIFSGNEASIQLARRICKEVGDDPAIWIPLFHEQRKQLYEQ